MAYGESSTTNVLTVLLAGDGVVMFELWMSWGACCDFLVLSIEVAEGAFRTAEQNGFQSTNDATKPIGSQRLRTLLALPHFAAFRDRFSRATAIVPNSQES